MPLDPTYGPLYGIGTDAAMTSGGDFTGRHQVASVDVFDGTIHRGAGGTMHALPTHLAPSRPASNFCHCYWPVPLFCVPPGVWPAVEERWHVYDVLG